MGFSPTPSTTTSEPGVTRAATRKKAAEEKSPGTTRSLAGKGPVRQVRTLLPSTSKGRPKWRKSLSVWSRVGVGSSTSVTPSAKRPARRRALFTWALGTGRV